MMINLVHLGHDTLVHATTRMIAPNRHGHDRLVVGINVPRLGSMANSNAIPTVGMILNANLQKGQILAKCTDKTEDVTT